MNPRIGRISNPTIYNSKMLRGPCNGNAVSDRTCNIPASNNIGVIRRSRPIIRHGS